VSHVPDTHGLRRAIDVEDETLSLDRVLKVIEPAKRLRFIILDACRDNSFAVYEENRCHPLDRARSSNQYQALMSIRCS